MLTVADDGSGGNVHERAVHVLWWRFVSVRHLEPHHRIDACTRCCAGSRWLKYRNAAGELSPEHSPCAANAHAGNIKA